MTLPRLAESSSHLDVRFYGREAAPPRGAWLAAPVSRSGALTPAARRMDARLGGILSAALKARPMTGAAGEVVRVFAPSGKGVAGVFLYGTTPARPDRSRPAIRQCGGQEGRQALPQEAAAGPRRDEPRARRREGGRSPLRRHGCRQGLRAVARPPPEPPPLSPSARARCSARGASRCTRGARPPSPSPPSCGSRSPGVRASMRPSAHGGPSPRGCSSPAPS